MPSWVPDFITPQLIVSVITLAVVVHVILGSVAYLVQAERKVSAYIQDRIGPNRTGFDFGLPFLSFLKGCLGLGQPLADGIKFLTKEDFTPSRVDKILFTLAPAIVVIPALIGFAVIPWGGYWNGDFLGWDLFDGVVLVAGADVNIGIVYLLAVASLGVYGITIGGWASNNKFSFLGGLRATAQMLSYEIPMGLIILVVLLTVGSLRTTDIIQYQTDHGWLVFAHPMAAVIFYICILAESNRAPFDNAEAEQELVGGYHTEYSSMRFALYFLAEYAHIVTGTAFFVLLFFGGFEPLPFMQVWGNEATGFLAVLAKFGIFFGKTVTIVMLTMVIRWTIPRLRYDQIMVMGWSALIPMSLLLVIATSVAVYLGWHTKPGVVAVGLLLGVNVVAFVLSVLGQPLFPKPLSNRKLPLYGSRFSPVEGERVFTRPSGRMALEDRPIEGTAPTA
jgi:NADH-quinone oxidoreductase subunit H